MESMRIEVSSDFNSVNTRINHLESQNDKIYSEIEKINYVVEQLENEPKFHLIYLQTERKSNSSLLSEYSEKFISESFEIRGYYCKITYHIEIWDPTWGNYVYGDFKFYNETSTRQLITSVSIEAQSSIEDFIGEIPLVLKPGIYSIEFIAGIPKNTDFIIEGYDIIVWDYY
jgi:hypothetical protein